MQYKYLLPLFYSISLRSNKHNISYKSIKLAAGIDLYVCGAFVEARLRAVRVL